MSAADSSPPSHRRRKRPAGKAEALDEAIGMIYEAASDVALWPKALTSIVSFVGNSGSHLAFIDDVTGLISPDVFVGMPPELMNKYNGERVKSCPRIQSARRNPLGAMCYDYQHIPENEIDRNEYYDWLQRQGDSIRYYLATQLDTYNGSEGWLSMAFRRSEGHAGPEHMRRLQAVLPHVNRAVRISQRLGNWELASSGTLAALNALDFCVYILGTGERLLQMNANGDRLLRAGKVIRMTGGRLQLTDPEADRAFGRYVAQARNPQHGASSDGGGLMVRCQVSGEAYRVTVSPLRMQIRELGFGTTSAIVFVECKTHAVAEPATLQERFRLTPAETRLAVGLAQGRSLREIATAHGVSTNTVRSQLQSLLQKTGAKRQAELVRMLLVP